MKIRLIAFAFAFALLFGSPAFAANPSIEVWKSTTCECCGNWVDLEANGFDVKVNAADPSLLDRVRRDAGISDKLAACHTAKIDGYFIEGHVPGTDIKRLMDEKPDAIGLTVPGMPMGSPGMEQGASPKNTTCCSSRRTARQRSLQAISLETSTALGPRPYRDGNENSHAERAVARDSPSKLSQHKCGYASRMYSGERVGKASRKVTAGLAKLVEAVNQ